MGLLKVDEHSRGFRPDRCVGYEPPGAERGPLAVGAVEVLADLFRQLLFGVPSRPLPVAGVGDGACLGDPVAPAIAERPGRGRIDEVIVESGENLGDVLLVRSTGLEAFLPMTEAVPVAPVRRQQPHQAPSFAP
jgi:hypothetical protein